MNISSNQTGDNIFALSSGRGKSGVAVIRLSGPGTGDVISRLAGPLPKPRHASLREFRRPATNEIIDQGLLLWFPGPNSFTGEDVAEIHGHGGRAVISALIDVLVMQPDMRAAEPGEFTRRAFENGKLDLTETEGLADLIDAETEAQRKQAVHQMAGGLSDIYQDWRYQLIHAQALIEAEIDFSDEDDVGGEAVELAEDIVKTLKSEITNHLDSGKSGEIIRDGYRVVLAGPPNVGKSSLLNCLAQRDAAITSAEAGTTRDAIEVFLDLEGWPVIITDTAGIRAGGDISDVEREGISRSLKHAERADLIIWVTDANNPNHPESDDNDGLTANSGSIVTIANKSDLLEKPAASGPADTGTAHAPDLYVSAKSGEGMDALISLITSSAEKDMTGIDAPIITRARHREHLSQCAEAVHLFLDQPARDLELRAEELRLAAQSLGRITGHIDVEDILDNLFSSFCIGK